MSTLSGFELSSRAQDHLRCLIYGLDPRTGDALVDVSAFSNAEVLRSLVFALEVLERRSGLDVERQRQDRVGAPWGGEEDEKLLAEFRTGTELGQIAAEHGRSEGAILSRLVKLEVLPSRDQARAHFRRSLT